MWLRVRLVNRTFKKQTPGHRVVFLVVTIDSHGAFPLKSVKGEFSAKPFEMLRGDNLRWTRIPFRGCSNGGTPTRLMLQKPRQSSVGIVPWLVYVT